MIKKTLLIFLAVALAVCFWFAISYRAGGRAKEPPPQTAGENNNRPSANPTGNSIDLVRPLFLDK